MFLIGIKYPPEIMEGGLRTYTATNHQGATQGHQILMGMSVSGYLMNEDGMNNSMFSPKKAEKYFIS